MITNRPQRAPTRRTLLRFLTMQALMLLLSVVVLVLWPDRAIALAPIVFMCFGHTVMLWLEAYEHRLGEPDSVAECK